jgi:hypothetical protein
MTRTILISLIACLLAAGSASATMVGLDGATLATFDHIASSSPLPYGTFATGSGADYAAFSTVWKQDSATSGWATMGTTLAKGSFTWTSADTLCLSVRNDNESQWHFLLYVSDGVVTKSSADVGFLVPGQTAVLSLALAGLDLTDALSIWVRVESTNPWSPRSGGGLDRNAEYTLASVPVPPAVWLLGGGLLGLVGIRRRFRKR